ncbi:major capsid protein [Neisseria perflava]|uniref:major capsid protein n=1 Tax=Neisseria perflava TaxID=33053 RepID=UPI00209EC6E6|nr:major capsid protein [Neisseria perflava]MCP1659338.1 hypothetical protein [Neisseria perflava]
MKQFPFTNEELTLAVNELPGLDTTIGNLGIFKAEYHATTRVRVDKKDSTLTLVKSQERGAGGEAGTSDKRTSRIFETVHLPRHRTVLAEDVQNLRQFGGTGLERPVNYMNDALTAMKGDIDITREHLMLGALNGKILDADGSEIYDLYTEFDIKGGRTKKSWALSSADTKVGAKMDEAKRHIRKLSGGEVVSGFTVLCSPEFIDALKYHDSMVELYKRFEAGKVYREDGGVEFVHNGISFIEYNNDFGTKAAKVEAGSAIMLPNGTRSTFVEVFAPSDTISAVNTLAKPYYASAELIGHEKGWDLEAQSNPLPLVLRPNLVITLTAD